MQWIKNLSFLPNFDSIMSPDNTCFSGTLSGQTKEQEPLTLFGINMKSEKYTPVKKKLQAFTIQENGLLLSFLFKVFPGTSRTRVKEYLRFRQVKVNGSVTTQFDQPLLPGDEVTVNTVRGAAGGLEPKLDVKIVYEDKDLIVAEKPEGLLTVGSETVRTRTAIKAINEYLNQKHRLKARGRGRSGHSGDSKMVFVVHRLDREASGLLVFAKNPETKNYLQDHWHEFRKNYFAVVEGVMPNPSGTIESYLKENKFLKVYSTTKAADAKYSVTHYKVLRSNGKYTLLEIELETGRKHQIRVHLSDLGHPIAGDDRYGTKTDPVKRLALHACRLEFRHPATGRELVFASALPNALKKMMN
jgi:23S rRNA pseudouridine1911/1915/1917 synthase